MVKGFNTRYNRRLLCHCLRSPQVFSPLLSGARDDRITGAGVICARLITRAASQWVITAAGGH